MDNEKSRVRPRAFWLPIVLALCTCAQNWPGAPAAAGGEVHGQVSITTASSRRLASAGAYPGRTVTLPKAEASDEMSNVVVFVDLPQPAAVTPSRAAIRQTDEAFVPHIVSIVRGSMVTFLNDDPIFHNVFSLSSGASFDLGRFPRGDSRSRRFDRPGLFKVFCHLHSHMSAVIRVFDHPYFATPDASGHVIIPDVPVGRHRVVAWHERAGEVALDATVVEGASVSLIFALPLGTAR